MSAGIILVLTFFLQVQNVYATGKTVTGVITYNDKPISEYTDAYPSLWMRNEATGQAVNDIKYNYDSRGNFTIFNLEPGKYYLEFSFDAASPFDSMPLPGDYSGGKYIEVQSNQSQTIVNISIATRIHLLSP